MTDRCPHCECYLEGNSHYCLTLDQRVYHNAIETPEEE